jgi:hypothetical protein
MVPVGISYLSHRPATSNAYRSWLWTAVIIIFLVVIITIVIAFTIALPASTLQVPFAMVHQQWPIGSQPRCNGAITITGTLVHDTSFEIMLGGFMATALICDLFSIYNLSMPSQEASLSLGIIFQILKDLLKGLGLLLFRHFV